MTKRKEWTPIRTLKGYEVLIASTRRLSLYWRGENKYFLVGFFDDELKEYSFNGMNHKTARSLLFRKTNELMRDFETA